MFETNLQIGDKFELLVPCIGNEKGSIGYVYEVYDDLSEEGEQAVQLIFENGEYCGFSHDEMSWLIKYAGHDKRFELYNFTSTIAVRNDFGNGYWKWEQTDK